MARLRRLFACALVATALACTTPTIPLPPPADPTVQKGADANTYRLTSVEGAEPNALVIAVSRNTALTSAERVTGTLADEHGTWTLVVRGQAEDILDLSQESGTTRSPSTTVTLR